MLYSLSKLEAAVTELSISNSNYCNQIKELQTNMDVFWDCMYKDERDLAQFMQYNRRENVEIVGIPDSIPDNRPEGVVIEILRRIGVNLSHYDIAGCHRLKNRKIDSSNVILRFICRKHAKETLTNKYKLHFMVPEYKDLCIVDNLCPKYKSIFDNCVELKKDNKIKYFVLSMVQSL